MLILSGRMRVASSPKTASRPPVVTALIESSTELRGKFLDRTFTLQSACEADPCPITSRPVADRCPLGSGATLVLTRLRPVPHIRPAPSHVRKSYA